MEIEKDYINTLNIKASVHDRLHFENKDLDDEIIQSTLLRLIVLRNIYYSRFPILLQNI